MKAHGRIGREQGLSFSQHFSRQVERVPADGCSQVPEMNPDLVGSSGPWGGFEEGGVVGEPFQDAELGQGGQAVGIDQASSRGRWRSADGGVGLEGVAGWLSLNPGVVALEDLSVLELQLDLSCVAPGLAKEQGS